MSTHAAARRRRVDASVLAAAPRGHVAPKILRACVCDGGVKLAWENER